MVQSMPKKRSSSILARLPVAVPEGVVVAADRGAGRQARAGFDKSARAQDAEEFITGGQYTLQRNHSTSQQT